MNLTTKMSQQLKREAEKKEIRDPTASSLATVNNIGQPNVRMVLLKEVSSMGFVLCYMYFVFN